MDCTIFAERFAGKIISKNQRTPSVGASLLAMLLTYKDRQQAGSYADEIFQPSV